jgi:hypothetical protein
MSPPTSPRIGTLTLLFLLTEGRVGGQEGLLDRRTSR